MCIAICCVWLPVSRAQQANDQPAGDRPVATLSKNKILIGEQVYLTLAIPPSLSNGKNITWPRMVDTINKNIEILDSVIDLKDPAKGLTKKYLITSFDSGYYAIQPFAFKLDSSLAETNALLLEVHTIDVDTTKGFKDIKEIKAENYTFTEKVKDFLQWLLEHWYVPLAILVAIALLIIYIVKKRRKKKPVVTEPVIVLPLHEQLLIDLDKLEARQLWQNNQVKLYYVELTELLRAYIEKRFKVKALEQTTVQLVNNLKTSGIHAEALQVLKNILELADMVKFAKAVPTGYENQALMDNARQFALLTKVMEEPKSE